MTIDKYFDPLNIEHIKAFSYLRSHGAWPEWFYEEYQYNCTDDGYTPFWLIEIHRKLAFCWVDHILNNMDDLK